MVRKIQASNELLHKALGSIDTPERFNAKRLKLATHVWQSMKDTDSRECRTCHDYSSMDYGVQGRRASRIHQQGFEKDGTCIDCHIRHRPYPATPIYPSGQRRAAGLRPHVPAHECCAPAGTG